MRLSLLLAGLAAAALVPVSANCAQSNPGGDLLLSMQPRASGSYLGVRLTDIDNERAKALRLGDPRGVEVKRVEEGSPAEEAGLKAGDVILSYNGENILGAQQLGRLVAETPQGRKVKIQYWRDGKTAETVVTTGAAHSSWTFPRAPGFEMPEIRGFNIPDIPNPIVIWKNSMLGFECEQIDSQLAEFFGVKHGVLIRSVDKGSPGEKAGLRAGDVVTAVGGRTVSSARDLSSYIFSRAESHPPQPITVELTRTKKSVTITLNLPEGER